MLQNRPDRFHDLQFDTCVLVECLHFLTVSSQRMRTKRVIEIDIGNTNYHNTFLQ